MLFISLKRFYIQDREAENPENPVCGASIDEEQASIPALVKLVEDDEMVSKTAMCIKKYHALDEKLLSVLFHQEEMFHFKQFLTSPISN